MKTNMKRKIVEVVLSALVVMNVMAVAACGKEEEVTPTPVPTATVAPTKAPTSTPTPAPTATSTPRPTATATPKPTATNTPIPTATTAPVPTEAPVDDNTPKTGDSDVLAYLAIAAAASSALFFTVSKLSRRG